MKGTLTFNDAAKPGEEVRVELWLTPMEVGQMKVFLDQACARPHTLPVRQLGAIMTDAERTLAQAFGKDTG